MPHTVLLGKPSVEDIFKSLRPLLIRDERGILRTIESYLESEKVDSDRISRSSGMEDRQFSYYDQRQRRRGSGTVVPQG